jgi:hypothetical protein
MSVVSVSDISFGSGLKQLLVWDAATGLPVGEPVTGRVEAVAVGRAGGRDLIFVGTYTNKVDFWDAASEPTAERIESHTDSVTAVAVAVSAAAASSSPAAGTAPCGCGIRPPANRSAIRRPCRPCDRSRARPGR